ncbi:unnamed protein product [[Actinomadura] parvosata subsp. kistnae]|uniref:hypothetical protein n=1 Tax=[Actinomadura] parvosata TaxID=1955412 RepID=UPI000D29E224|nr:hypothetical protein [Nonomuraea sp. ATCC 55076]SPL92018.1 unnamed protein product [Actinomadura parvosata subsp. kistnae]
MMLALTATNVGVMALYVVLYLVDDPRLLVVLAAVGLVAGILGSALLAGSREPCRRGFGIALTSGWAMVVVGVPVFLMVS